MKASLGSVASLRRLLSGAVVLVLAVPAAHAQEAQCLTAPPAACPAPAPCPGQAPAPSATTSPAQPEAAAAPAEPSLPGEQAAARGGAEAAFTPDFLGDLLFANRSILFSYNRAAGPINVVSPGSTSIINSTIADDNSPIPRDRIGFRYNHFDDSQSVTGFGPAVFNSAGVGTASAETRNYNLDRYTFNVEKTFFDQLASVELRVPFSTTLSPNLDLSAGDVTGPTGPNGFPVTSTPGNTLGRDGTQFEDISVIFKALAYKSDVFALSGGLGVTIPTGADTDVRVTDYSGSTTQGLATIQRVRDFHIDNETWALSPFLAVLATPCDRFFVQGFLEFDCPLNTDTINYTNVYTRGTAPSVAAFQQLAQFGGSRTFNPTLSAPYSVSNGISDQPLLHLDVGTGYWLFRDASRTWITGIAPTMELHYTTTLKDASIVTLPADPLFVINPQNPRQLIPEPPPQIGNQRNTVNLFDMTLGTTFYLCNRATLATGVSFPLLGGENRTYDWEFHVQLNYYFGGPRYREVPNLE